MEKQRKQDNTLLAELAETPFAGHLAPSFSEGVTSTVSCCYLLPRNDSQGSPSLQLSWAHGGPQLCGGDGQEGQLPFSYTVGS